MANSDKQYHPITIYINMDIRQLNSKNISDNVSVNQFNK